MTPDIADIIAGALQTSRAHAWELIREAELAEKQEPVGQLQESAFGRGQVLWFKKPADLSMLYTHTAPVNQQLLEALKQAKDAIAEWGSYASEYFQKKHDLQGDLDAVQEAITAARSAIAAEGKV